MSWLFLLAYTCSGLAGLIYEVSWTRLLTLYIGHTTAAASAVVAAFLGGLAAGAAAGGASASRIDPRRSLQAYVVLEIVIAVAALLVPFELRLFTPLLAWAYRDGSGMALFAGTRLVSCLVMVFLPALALGATFPLAIRWFAAGSTSAARAAGTLYALNTVGAAIGALWAGFYLIPAVGISGTTAIGIAASLTAAASGLLLLRRRSSSPSAALPRTGKGSHRSTPRTSAPPPSSLWLAMIVLGLSGFAALVHEIAWTRILAMVLGPTTYAFAATLAAVVAGVAIGSGTGTALVARTRHPAAWLTLTLAAAAMTASVTYWLAGTEVPLLVARELANAPDLFDQLLRQGTLLTAMLIVPTAACVGAAFPLAIALVDERAAAARFGAVYAVNTLGAVTGSLACGFVLIPRFGLQPSLRVVSGCLIAAAAVVIVSGPLTRRARAGGLVALLGATLVLVLSPPWDRELLASGVYLYAPYVPKDLDLGTQLRAGSLLYYREGAAATVSVKRLTGTTTLAVDGKTDASNRGDMLTQKLVAHLPLLLHDNPLDVAIVGLGSGVTLGAALRHPIARADVLEISPEVVAASHFFDQENHHALADPRAKVIVGDGRSHLLLSRRKYDVIISEPSNPWIAGVASLFTREFFTAVRERLAPGGVVCQWANAYNISDPDLRSIVATFRSVFPNATLWLVGTDDVLLVASEGSSDAQLRRIERNWNRGEVAADLRDSAVAEPFSLWSLFAGGPDQLARYAGGAPLLTDDRLTLEFSSPRELHRRDAGRNGIALDALLAEEDGPPTLQRAKAAAGVSQWRNRAAMMARRDAYSVAYDDYVRALTIDANDPAALDGFVRTALLLRRATDALAWIKALAATGPEQPARLVAVSKLLAAAGQPQDAIAAARLAQALVSDHSTLALEQLASLYADASDTAALDDIVTRLEQVAPTAAATSYYAAVATFLRGNAAGAVQRGNAAVRADPNYAPVYDLLGAAHTRLGQLDSAREAFRASLAFDAHDSTAYTNLGLVELAAGHRALARNYFAEALWLTPESPVAREGLRRAAAE